MKKILDYKKHDFYTIDNLEQFSLEDFRKVHTQSRQKYVDDVNYYLLQNKQITKPYTDYNKIREDVETGKIHLPFMPTIQQWSTLKTILGSKFSEILYGGAAGAAKSYLGAYFITSSALQYGNTTYLVGRQTITNLKKSVVLSLDDVLEKEFGLKKDKWTTINGVKVRYQYNSTENVYKFSNGSKIFLMALDYRPSDSEYKRFDGLLFTHAWIDEVSEISEAAINKIGERVGRQGNERMGIRGIVLMTTNPTGGWVKEKFYKPWAKGITPKRSIFIPANTATNGHLPFDYIEDLFNKPKANKRRQLLGDWDYSENNGELLDFEQIQAVWYNTPAQSSQMYVTVDVGGTSAKADNTVYTIWRGWEVIEIRNKKPINVEDIISEIRNICSEYNIPIKNVAIDTIGVGTHVASSSFLSGIYPFASSHSTMIDPKEMGYKEKENKYGEIELDMHTRKNEYTNLRTQCAFILTAKVKSGEFAIRVNPTQSHPTKANKEGTLKDAVEAEFSVLKDKNWDKVESKRQLVSKDIMKADLLYSPDLIDTFIMRGVFDLIENYERVDEKKTTPLKERKFFQKRSNPFRFI